MTGPEPAAVESERRERIAYVLLVGMAICFGGTWVAGAWAVDAIRPFTVAAARFSLASGLLLTWAASRGIAIRPRLADLPLILVLGLTAVAGYNAFFLYGLTLAPASDGAIIVPGMVPVFTAVLARAFLGDRTGRSGIAGLLLAIVGLVVVVGPSAGAGTDRIIGDLLFLAGAVCWAIYSVVGRTATRRFHPVAATLFATLAGTVVLVPLAAAESGWQALTAAPALPLAGVLYLGLFGTVLAFVFFYEGVRRIGPARASAFAVLVPLVGVASSAALLGEPLSVATVAGGALVVAGLVLIQRGAHAPVEHRSDGRSVSQPVDAAVEPAD